MLIRIATWNLHQGGLPTTWDALASLDADFVLVQEARSPHPTWLPPNNVQALPTLIEPEHWTSTGGRTWSAGIVQLNPSFEFRPRQPTLRRSEHGSLDQGAEESRGTLAVGDVFLNDQPVLTLASGYGMWEKDETGTSISEGTMHRVLDDLFTHTPSELPTVFGGDFNIWIQPHQGGVWPAYQAVFDRIADHGLVDCLHGGDGMGRSPLAECPCGGGSECRHVRTYRHRWQAGSKPWQNDYIFASTVLHEHLVRCEVLDDEQYWSLSDHCPILATFDL